MEAIGCTLAVLPIFSLCLEYFEYFKTAQSLSADCQILLLKLDFEHERFIIWGEKHRIGIDANGVQDSGPDNWTTDNLNLVKDALTLIEALFKDSRALYDKYGVKQLEPTASRERRGRAKNEPRQVEAAGKFISTAALKRFRRRSKTEITMVDGTDHSASRPGLTMRTKWAISDKSKFEVLVRDIREFVTSLYDILPVPNKESDRMVLDDMRSLLPDTSRLKQIELASEDLYTTWSEAASLIVLASEMGSVAPASLLNGPQIQEFVRESAETAASPEQLAEVNAELLSASKVDFFVVFTPECLSVSTTMPCHPISVGETCVLKADFPSFTPEGTNVFGSLGRRITESINPSLPSTALEILQAFNIDCEDFQKLAIEGLLPVADVKVYCPPCACAIRTALRICQEKSSELIKYVVRVDERLPSSCCSYSTIVDTISSLLRTIQLTESDQLGRLTDILHFSMLRFLDRQWIEKMIYRLESKPPRLRDKTSLIRRVGQLVSETAAKEIHAVFISEMDYLRPFLEISTFPRLPRPPRVNEIYRMQKSAPAVPWKIKYLGTFTPKNFRSLWAVEVNEIPSGYKADAPGARTEMTDLNVL